MTNELAAWTDGFGHFMQNSLPPSAWGPGRLDAFGMIFNRVTALDLGIEANYRPADAPVRYPFLWNAAFQDRTQWDGAAPNGSYVKALARNAGEAFGVFGQFAPVHGFGVVDYDNSLLFRQLQSLEVAIGTLRPPAWPRAVFGLNQGIVARGAGLFDANCASCHAARPSSAVSGLWSTPVCRVGTDSKMYAYAGGDPINGTDPSGLAPGDGAFRDGVNGTSFGGSQGAAGVGQGGSGGSSGGGGNGGLGGSGHGGGGGSCTGACAVDAAARQRVVNFINSNENGARFFSGYPGIGYDQNGVAYSEGGQSNYLADVGDVLGKLWNLPNDAIGLVAGAAEIGSGLIEGTNVHIALGNDALQIIGGGLGNGAITFGNVQLYQGYFKDVNGVRQAYAPNASLPNSYDGLGPIGIGLHEGGHSIQGEVYGPGFLVGYFLSGLLSGQGVISPGNAFELGADQGCSTLAAFG